MAMRLLRALPPLPLERTDKGCALADSAPSIDSPVTAYAAAVAARKAAELVVQQAAQPTPEQRAEAQGARRREAFCLGVLQAENQSDTDRGRPDSALNNSQHTS
ncbi:hypothetical protein GCM10007320_34870 [Pseudorhodoferax aquiterrae]|uniref:Uncharacterized protein n=1 Tax=Pseudorhodoferax aquiterrae TaxID=747304 RepID=A0ABQ3G5H0_9BURK|nr:hypothetical protein GCM10007320_34870 [Pseudorhodoferax aquiterrae]